MTLTIHPHSVINAKDTKTEYIFSQLFIFLVANYSIMTSVCGVIARQEGSWDMLVKVKENKNYATT